MEYTILKEYRQDLYETFTRSPDVLMDIIDSLIWETRRKYPIDLTRAPSFRRRWPSFYKSLQRGRFSRKQLRLLACIYYPLVPEERPVLIIDATSILRRLAPTSPNRQYVHTADATTPGGKPVGGGWQFALLVGAPATTSSWTHVLDCTRIPTNSTPAALALGQLTRVLPALPRRPLVLGDRYYGSVTFVRSLQPLACDGLLRIQTHRVFFRQPAPRPAEPSPGRPATKGARFQPKDPTTHGEPDATWSGVDARGRAVTVDAWQDLGFADDLTVRVTVVRCTRQDGPDTRRDARVIWVVWVSPSAAPLADIPDYYARRFSIEHGIRFDKQTLGWADLHVRSSTTFQRWTDLVMCAHNLIGLARDLVDLKPLPWDRKTEGERTPQQVQRALADILVKLGTPAAPAQPRGKSPGRAKGTVITPAPRYPIRYKGKNKPPSEEAVAH
jgi:hypothetical protein